MAKWDMGCPWCNAREGEMHAATCKPPTFGATSISMGGTLCPFCNFIGAHSEGCPIGTSTEGRKDDGYDSLRYVLTLAIEQASVGKGKERHANGKPFDRQPIMEIGRMVGSGYPLGQAMKKAQESTRLPPDRAKAELLGAINYLAAAYMLLDG